MKKNIFVFLLAKIDYIVFLLFLFFVPFSFCDFFPSLNSSVYTLPFYFSLIGFPLCFLRYFVIERKTDRSIWFIFFGFIFCFLNSVLHAAIMPSKYFGYYELFPFSVSLNNSVQILYAIFSILYCAIEVKTYGKKRACIVVFAFSSSIVALGGILQIFVINKLLINVYDLLAMTKIIRPSWFIIKSSKVSLFCPEPAWATALILMYLVPICACIFLKCEKNKIFWRIWSGTMIAILLFEAYSTKSAEMYATIAFIVFEIIIYLYVIFIKRKQLLGMFALMLASIGIVALIVSVPLLRELLINKLFSKSNWSTGTRMSYVYNAFISFAKRPLLGNGNGLYSFYYPENIIDTWMASSPEVRQMLSGEIGLPSFAPTVLYLLSGYGIVGSLFLVAPIVVFVRKFFYESVHDKRIRLIYVFVMISYFFTSLFVESIIANLYIPISFCFPLLFESRKGYKRYSEGDTIGVLVTTFNKTKEEIISMASKMNLQTDCIVRNQGTYDCDCTVLINNNKLRIVGVKKEKGASKNRNELLKLCCWDYAIFADDDVVFSDGYNSTLLNSFKKHRNIQAIKYRVNLKNRRVHNNVNHYFRTLGDYFDCTDIGPLSFCFSVDFLKKNEIFFNEIIGPGTTCIKASEDVLFYKEYFKNGGNLCLINNELCSCNNDESTWYSGFDDDYVFTVGGAYYLVYNSLYPLFFIKFIIKNRNMIKNKNDLFNILRRLFAGKTTAKILLGVGKNVNYYSLNI